MGWERQKPERAVRKEECLVRRAPARRRSLVRFVARAEVEVRGSSSRVGVGVGFEGNSARFLQGAPLLEQGWRGSRLRGWSCRPCPLLGVLGFVRKRGGEASTSLPNRPKLTEADDLSTHISQCYRGYLGIGRPGDYSPSSPQSWISTSVAVTERRPHLHRSWDRPVAVSCLSPTLACLPRRCQTPRHPDTQSGFLDTPWLD